MKQVLIIHIETIDVPDEGFVDGGWYCGRQYYKRKLGQPGEVLTNKGTGVLKEMTQKEKQNLEQQLHNRVVFKQSE